MPCVSGLGLGYEWVVEASSGWDVESGFPHDSLLFPLGRLAELPSTESISSGGGPYLRTAGHEVVYWVIADPPARRPPASPPWVNIAEWSHHAHCSHTRWLTDLPLPGPCSFRKESFLPALFCEIGTRVMAAVSGPDALGLMPRCTVALLLRDLLPDVRPRMSPLLLLGMAVLRLDAQKALSPCYLVSASAVNLLCSNFSVLCLRPMNRHYHLAFSVVFLVASIFSSDSPRLASFRLLRAKFATNHGLLATASFFAPPPASFAPKQPTPPRCELVRPGPAAGARGPPPKLIWWLSSHCNCTVRPEQPL